LESKGLISTRH